MQDILSSIEVALSPLAIPVTPEGSLTKAVTDQWIFALAYDKPLYAAGRGISHSQLIQVLHDNELFIDREHLKQQLLTATVIKPPQEPAFTFIDLFAGIGGMRIGFQNAGGTCVFSSEYDKNAQETYARNHGDFPFGDITKIPVENIPDHDVLIGGFPCQPFSHAGVSARNAVGKEHGFKCETQGNLFFNIMDIVAIKKPKILFLENVRNIERHDGGHTFKVIKQSIEDAGYVFKYAIIDSSSVVPQRRVRCYMVCYDKDLPVDFQFPEFQGVPIPLKTILEPTVDASFTISDRLWKGHIDRTQRNLERGTGFTAYTADLNKPSNTLVARYGKDGKECLIPQEGKNPRLLTPRECARLQGFPEEFLLPKAKTPAYKQFGNSVSVPVIEQISKKMIKDLM